MVASARLADNIHIIPQILKKINCANEKVWTVEGDVRFIASYIITKAQNISLKMV